MILTPDNEYAVLLDSCVLIPMPLCDVLLRMAEEPALYRPLWSESILQEVGKALIEDLGLTEKQRDRRILVMRDFFPEALIPIVPQDLSAGLTCVPHENDRHVLAAAIRGKADAILTLNKRDFPEECLKDYDVIRMSPDEFLVHQFHLNPVGVMDKLDAQALAIKNTRQEIISRLREKLQAPAFAELLEHA